MALLALLSAGFMLVATAAAQASPVASPISTSFNPLPDDMQPVLYSTDGLFQTIYLVDLHDNATASELASSRSGQDGILLPYNAQAPNELPPHNVPLLSCDPEDWTGMISLDEVYQRAKNAMVPAIIFYTTRQDQCALKINPDDYTYLYSLTDGDAASQFLGAFQSPAWSGGIEVRVLTEQAYHDNYANGQGTASTAVAMIILYSITGLITGLFVIIIVTGAIRAHRHPERYGPRNTVGQTRQSRAKGMARAMLDTIPIVKFGEQAPQQNKGTDLELGSRASQSPEPQTSTPSGQHTDTASPEAGTDVANVEKDEFRQVDGPAPAISGSNNDSAADDNGLGCSICTEDFEKGEDIRLLPCNHKFHPACVDPWLLDVSGTCPLCRVDLRPAEAAEQSTDGTAQAEGQNNGSDNLPPPLDPNAATSPRSRRRLDALRSMFHWRRMEELTQEERIQALRQFREQEQRRRDRHASTVSQGDEGAQDDRSRWARFRSIISGPL